MSEVEQADGVYACTDSDDLLMRLFRPSTANGRGIIMVHGGAWTANDRTTPWVMCEALAAAGMLVASLDFRCGPDFKHPTASADIAAGIPAGCGGHGGTAGLRSCKGAPGVLRDIPETRGRSTSENLWKYTS